MAFSGEGAAAGATAGAAFGPIGIGVGAVVGGFLGGSAKKKSSSGGSAALPAGSDQLTNSAINFGDQRIASGVSFAIQPGNSASDLLTALTGGGGDGHRLTLAESLDQLGGEVGGVGGFPWVSFTASTAATVGVVYLLVRHKRKAA